MSVLQAGKSRIRYPIVSLQFFIDLVLPTPFFLGSTEPLTEISTKNISRGVKAVGAQRWEPYHFQAQLVLKSRSLNFPEPSEVVQACIGIV